MSFDPSIQNFLSSTVSDRTMCQSVANYLLKASENATVILGCIADAANADTVEQLDEIFMTLDEYGCLNAPIINLTVNEPGVMTTASDLITKIYNIADESTTTIVNEYARSLAESTAAVQAASECASVIARSMDDEVMDCKTEFYQRLQLRFGTLPDTAANLGYSFLDILGNKNTACREKIRALMQFIGLTDDIDNYSGIGIPDNDLTNVAQSNVYGCLTASLSQALSDVPSTIKSAIHSIKDTLTKLVDGILPGVRQSLNNAVSTLFTVKDAFSENNKFQDLTFGDYCSVLSMPLGKAKELFTPSFTNKLSNSRYLLIELGPWVSYWWKVETQVFVALHLIPISPIAMKAFFPEFTYDTGHVVDISQEFDNTFSKSDYDKYIVKVANCLNYARSNSQFDTDLVMKNALLNSIDLGCLYLALLYYCQSGFTATIFGTQEFSDFVSNIRHNYFGWEGTTGTVTSYDLAKIICGNNNAPYYNLNLNAASNSDFITFNIISVVVKALTGNDYYSPYYYTTSKLIGKYSLVTSDQLVQMVTKIAIVAVATVTTIVAFRFIGKLKRSMFLAEARIQRQSWEPEFFNDPVKMNGLYKEQKRLSLISNIVSSFSGSVKTLVSSVAKHVTTAISTVSNKMKQSISGNSNDKVTLETIAKLIK